jgi:hypothetical protein
LSHGISAWGSKDVFSCEGEAAAPHLLMGYLLA